MAAIGLDRNQKQLRILRLCLTSLALLVLASLCFVLYESRSALPERKCRTNGSYRPTKESLDTHPVPDWFQDAKFGLFVHWGLFSVPGFAPRGNFADVLQHNYDRAMLMHPYAEDYWNAIKDPTTPSAQFHRDRYSGMPYQGFREIFNRALKQWDAEGWARMFRDAGAKYVVMVAKYHDGYCLWPTAVRNTHEPNWFSERDLVGELAAAVRRHGLHFGIYYSGGVDWTFRPRISRTLGDYIWSTPGGDYPAYADAQVRELVGRYKPDVLWNDISWPTDEAGLFALFTDYYDTVPQGVVNDRWQPATIANRLMRLKPARFAFDLLMKAALARQPEFFSHMMPIPVAHSDFTTPEYTKYDRTQTKKWEMTRGIGNSFGYNRNEREDDYVPFEKLLSDLLDVVSKNGNLLLNVGPDGGEGKLPSEQLGRISRIGQWLAQNGEAVYGTRPWSRAEAQTTTGDPVRITQKGDLIYLTILGTPLGTSVVIRDLTVSGMAWLLADHRSISLQQDGADTVLALSSPLSGRYAPVIVIRTSPT